MDAKENTISSGWVALQDEDLLNCRICDLGLRLDRTPIFPRIERLYRELDDHGIPCHPVCYLTREWLCPDKEPTIGIPFPLAHPRLRKLEKTMMLEVEGGTEKTFMQLLRHETGHALNYAYQLYRKTRWRELFGPFSAPYHPHSYAVRPYSRKYVTHLPGNYAQAHPDEDFAETFAVWLTPGLDWRRKYRDTGALAKLDYVDHLMSRLASMKPAVPNGKKHWQASRLRSTLRSYYAWKRREFAEAYPGYFDPDLRSLFPEIDSESAEPAYRFLRRQQADLRETVCRWTHAPKYSVDSLLKRLMRRARELHLTHDPDRTQTVLTALAVWLTAQICSVDPEESS